MNKDSTVDTRRANRKSKYMKATALVAEELEIIENRIPPTNAASRRIAIRSIFASIETLLSDISKVLILKIPPPDHGSTHDKKHSYFLEVCALSDISYEIKQNGDLAIKPPRIPFKNRVLFVLKMMERTTESQVRPTEISGWDKFQAAIKIRDRITHPKTDDDLSVSQEEYDTAHEGLKWFILCHHRASGGQRY